jgi:hypothetical protein
MSKYRKYKDGSFSISKDFIKIMNEPTQALIEAVGYDFKMSEELTPESQREMTKFCMKCPGMQGAWIAKIYGVLQRLAWENFHQETGELPSKNYTVDLKRGRIVEVEDDFEEKMDTIIDQLVECARDAHKSVHDEPGIFYKIKKVLSNR